MRSLGPVLWLLVAVLPPAVPGAPPISFDHVQVPTDRVADVALRSAHPAGLALVQFDGPIKPAWRAALEDAGVRRLAYVPHEAYLVAAQERTPGELLALPGVRWVGPYRPEYKFNPAWRTAPATAEVEITVGAAVGLGRPLAQLVAETGYTLVSRWTEPAIEWAVVRAPAGALDALAMQPSVLFVEPVAEVRLDGERAAQIAAGALRKGEPGPNGAYYNALLEQWGVDGSGVTIQVQDDGLEQGDASGRPGTAHPDLLGRIAGIDNPTGDRRGDSGQGHGSLNAGIAAGNAATGVRDRDGFLLGQGIAPGARVFGTKIFRNNGAFDSGGASFTRLMQTARRAGATVSNNSWGTDLYGFYSANSREFDRIVRDADPDTPGAQPMTVVFSAGNAGPYPASVGAPRTAKSVIVVGASENSDADGTDGCDKQPRDADDAGDLASYSSRGPTNDGRFGPLLVAPGTHIQGPASTSDAYDGRGVCDPFWPAGQPWYARSSGTSHSAPIVAGAVALFAQHARERLGLDLSPALAKAALVASCQDLAGGDDGDGGTLGPVPDMHQGWGRLDLSRLVRDDVFVQDQAMRFWETGETVSFLVEPVDRSRPPRIALAWSDAPAAPLAHPVLVNDLDLRVRAFDAEGRPVSDYRGNVFAGGASVEGGSRDERNTLECVFPREVFPRYEITVAASRLADDGVPGNAHSIDQDFALYAGNARAVASRAVLALDADVHACTGAVRVTLRDADRIAEATVEVSFAAEGSGVSGRLVLHREASGAFMAVLALELLGLDHGDVLRFRATDADDGTGRAREAEARTWIDCRAPRVESFQFRDVLERTAILRWAMDEPGKARVVLAPADGAPSIVRDATPMLPVHELEFEDLVPATEYRVALELVDALGNRAVQEGYVLRTGRFTSLRRHDFNAGGEDWTPGSGWHWRDGAWDSGPAPAREGESSLVSSPVALPDTGRTLRLMIRHCYEFDRCGEGNLPADGGVVELRRKGETQWRRLMPAGGYPGRLELTCRNPLDPAAAYVGSTSGEWIVSEFDLAPHAGKTVTVRLRAGWDCDNCGQSFGWQVDAARFAELDVPLPEARLELAAEVVACSDALRVVLRDRDRAGGGRVPASARVDGGDPLAFDLLERDSDSGVFDGSVAVRPNAEANALAVRHDDRIVVGAAPAEAIAAVDCLPPEIRAVRIEGHTAERSVLLGWDTNEFASGTVHYGTAPGVYSASASVDELKTTQRATIVLGEAPVWYAAVEARDRVGNAAFDTNAGAHYRIDMTTPELVVRPDAVRLSVAEGGQRTAVVEIENAIADGRAIAWFARAFVTVDTGGADRPPVAADHAGGPDSFGYTWISSLHPAGPAPEWIEIGATGTVLDGLYDESLSRELDLGWPFPFYNDHRQYFRVGSNGYLTFGSLAVRGANTVLPNPSGPTWLVAPLWDDLILARDSRVLYQVFGDRLVVTWERMPRLFGRDPFTFQAVLLRDGRMRFNYREVGGPEDASTVGIQDGGGRTGLQVLYNERYLRDGLTIEIVPGVSWMEVSPRIGVLNAGASGRIDLFLRAGSLPPGVYRASLALETTVGSRVVPVELAVLDLPQRAALSLDRAFYGCRDAMRLEVRDRGLVGLDEIALDASASSGGSAVVRLHADLDGSGPGVFRGVLPLVPIADGEGQLVVRDGDRIVVRFTDPDTGSGAGEVVSATADVDCEPPRIEDVRVQRVSARFATIAWRTQEPAAGAVAAGTECGNLDRRAESARPAVEQTANLEQLEPDTAYRFVVSATDEAGNASLDDHGGECHAFRTLPLYCDVVAEEHLFAGSSASGIGNVLEMLVDSRLVEAVIPVELEARQDLRLVVYELTPDYAPWRILFDRTYYGIDAQRLDFSSGPLDLVFAAGRFYAVMLYWRFPTNAGWQTDAENPTLSRARVVAGLLGSWFDVARPKVTGLNYHMYYCFEPVAQPAATLALDRAVYGCRDRVGVLLRDSDLAGAATASVLALAGEDRETVTLFETHPGSWNFAGAIETGDGPPAPGDGVLQPRDTGMLAVGYHDADDGAGAAVLVEATAEVDCAAPRITDVAVASVGWSTAVVVWRTERPAAGAVRYGTDCARLDRLATRSGLATAQRVEIAGLEPETTYHFVVDATSVDGLAARADNGGACFALTTHDVRRVLKFVGWADPTPGAAPDAIVAALRSVRGDFLLTETEDEMLAGLDRADVLLLPPQRRSTPGDLETLGRRWVGMLDGFLAEGGSIVACDDDRYAWPLLAGVDLVTVEAVANAARQTVAAATDAAGHPLLASVPPLHYTAPRSAAFVIRSGTALLVTDEGAAHAWCDYRTDGRVVLLGHDYAVRTDALSRLLANAVFGDYPVQTERPVILAEGERWPCAGERRVQLRLPITLDDPAPALRITTLGGDLEWVFPAPHARVSGRFDGTVTLAGPPVVRDDGVVQLDDGDRVTLAYDKVDVEVPVDCAPPTILSVTAARDEADGVARVTVCIDEAGTVRVESGPACDALLDVHQQEYSGAGCGEFLVPAGKSGAVFFRVGATDEAGNATVDDHGGECYYIDVTPAERVLLFTRYADAGAGRELEQTRQALRETCASAAVIETDSADAVPGLLSDVDTLIVPEPARAAPAEIDALAERWGAALAAFVVRGGVLVACDPAGALGPLYAAAGIPAPVFAAAATRRTLSAPAGDHPLLEGVPLPVEGPDWSGVFHVDPASAVLADASGRACVFARRRGAGFVVGIGHDYYEPNEAFERVLGNAVCRLPAPPDATAVLSLSAARYDCSDRVTVTLLDGDLRGGEAVAVEVDSLRGDRETIELSELGAGSGVFEGGFTLAFADPAPDGVLEVAEVDTVTVRYSEAFPARTVSATADVDCRPPAIANVRAVDLRPDGATIRWETALPATSRVEYGVSVCGGDGMVADGAPVAAHAVVLRGLVPATEYRYRVASTNAAGQTSVDDDGGACYAFVTTRGKRLLVLTEYADRAPNGELQSILAALGSVTDDFVWTDLDDYRALEPALAVHDVLLVVDQEKAQPSRLAGIGEAWEQPLGQFVDDGGVAVFCDYVGSSWPIANRANLLRISISVDVTGQPVRVAAPDDPVAAGIDYLFIAPPNSSSYITTEGTVVVSASSELPVVIDKPLGKGNVVLFGHDFQSPNEAMRRMLANAVFNLPQERPVTPTPPPTARIYTEVVSGRPGEPDALFVVAVGIDGNDYGIVASYAFRASYPAGQVTLVSIVDAGEGLGASPQRSEETGAVRFSAFNAASQLANGRLCLLTLRTAPDVTVPYSIELEDFGPTPLVNSSLLFIPHRFDTRGTRNLGAADPVDRLGDPAPAGPVRFSYHDLFAVAAHWRRSWPAWDPDPNGIVDRRDLELLLGVGWPERRRPPLPAASAHE